jgi:7-cyano-7-deazaguanine reductase
LTAELPLGKPTRYPEAYDEGLLYAVERAPQRRALAIDALPFTGVDRWTAWEVAWLDRAGRPQAAIAQFDVPCTSPRIVESKSVKLWLASLYNERFASVEALRDQLAQALERATGASVALQVDRPERWLAYVREEPHATAIDGVVPSSFPASPDASLLRTQSQGVRETLLSHSFRSVCPVTGQPDYATLTIGYTGQRLDAAALAAYLFGFRRHPGFHEDCAERIFVDISRACAPRQLAVDASFTRRGGIDIRPFRTSDASFATPGPRDLRQ